jgi:Ran GTPase-activating protein (RanGAP) involved in mRNA processing and transport
MRELSKAGHNYNTPERIQELIAELQGNTEITSLNLEYNRIKNPAAISALATLLQKNRQITSLNLSANEINTPEALAALRELLRQNRQITSLNLPANKINTPEALAALRELLRQNPQITSLNLSENEINTPEALAALVGLLRQNPQIISLDLSFNNIRKEKMQDVVLALSGHRLTSLNLSGNNITRPAILDLIRLLRQNRQITSLDLSSSRFLRNNIGEDEIKGLDLSNTNVTSLNLSGNNITRPAIIAALGGLLRQNRQITSLNLSRDGINSLDAILALRDALRDTNVTSLNLSGNNITSPKKIAALRDALRNTNVTSLDLSHNDMERPSAIEDLRGLLRQNPQITSLDLSHTDLPIDELLSLVREFRHLHHVGINGELPGRIAEQLRFNRALHINAAVRLLWRKSPNLHSDLVRPILELEGVTMGLAPNEAASLIAEATAPAFNFQRGNPNAISFAPAEGGRPRISITFASIEVLRAFREKNEDTFRMLERSHAIVQHSGTAVEIIAPDAKIGTPLRIRLEAMKDELIPLKIKLQRPRVYTPSASAAAAAAPEAAAAAAARMGVIRRSLANELAKSRPESTRSTSQVAGAGGRNEERDLPGLEGSNEEKAVQVSTRFAESIANPNAQAAAPVPGQQPVGPHARIIAEQKANSSSCCNLL